MRKGGRDEERKGLVRKEEGRKKLGRGKEASKEVREMEGREEGRKIGMRRGGKE